MNIPERIRQWEKTEGIEFFKAAGVKEDSTVVDFGFGQGHFAVAAANTAGKTGHVYALDCAPAALEALKERIAAENLGNITVVDTGGSVAIALADATVDVMLCYDLLHHPGFNVHGILAEAGRVLKPGGILSVLPFHMTAKAIEGLTGEIEASGFGKPALLPGFGPHFGMVLQALNANADADFDSIEKGTVYNFTRM